MTVATVPLSAWFRFMEADLQLGETFDELRGTEHGDQTQPDCYEEAVADDKPMVLHWQLGVRQEHHEHYQVIG